MPNRINDISESLVSAVSKGEEFTVTVDARRRVPSTGVIFTADQVITSAHTIEREEEIAVYLKDGTRIFASLAGRDLALDLALLKLESGKSSPAKPESAPVNVGQLVLALGRPDSEGIQASFGIVSAISGPVRTHYGILEKFYRTDAMPFPGFSGGPLVSINGDLLGINTSLFGMGTLSTIPAPLVWSSAEELSLHGSVQRGYIGVRSQIVDISVEQQQLLKRKQDAGLLVVGLEPSSPAETARLLVGDILVRLADKPLSDHEDLQLLLNRDNINHEIPLQLLRGGKLMEMRIKIGARAA